MAWTPRRKAAVFSVALLLVSTGFVVSAAASTEGALTPFLQGHDFARERPLSRHGGALGLLVAADGADGVVRAEGAVATIQRDGEGVAERTTNERGVAVFQLRPGEYVLTVEWQGLSAERAIDFGPSARLALYFDEGGQPRWIQTDHREFERRGEGAPLWVRVAEFHDGSPEAIPGAVVEIYRIQDGVRGELVANGTTNEQGLAPFHLHRGGYEVVVIYDGETQSQMRRHHDPGRMLFAVGDEPAPTQRPPPTRG